MLKLTCIVCPIGCSLEVEDNGNNLNVTGNKCPRGEAYAKEEIRSPKRVVTATSPINGAGDGLNQTIRRVPVKTISPCPKEKIPALLQDIYASKVTLPVKVGDVVIKNWNGLGVDVVVTRNIE